MNEVDLLKIASGSSKNINFSKNKIKTFKFIQHFPSYIDFKPKKITFKKIEEVLELDDIKWWSKQPNFYGYFGKVNNYKNLDEHKTLLMALYDYDKEYYGCKKWYVLGFILGMGGIDLLPIVNGNMATHKVNCCIRIANSIISDDLNFMSEEIQKQIYNEMKWDINKPICKCDCGFDKL